MLNLRKFLESIQSIPYILIKMDVPYMPKDFPDSYPNKDMDIITKAECKYYILEKLIEFLSLNGFRKDIIHKGGSILIRLHEGNNFHYQFDISTNFFNLPKYLIEESIDERFVRDCYAITPKKYEIAYRLVAYINKKKPWHLDYIKNSKTFADEVLLRKIGLLEKYYELT